MDIRDYTPDDLDQVLSVTYATFQPFFEQSFPEMVGHDEVLVAHQHGQWREDYARDIPLLHDPDARKFLALAIEAGRVIGYIAWGPDRRPRHANIDILAVAPDSRRQGVAEQLVDHAMDRMRADGQEVVELGTGGDWFHEPARRLYERLGFHAVPVVAYLRRL